MTLPIKKRGQVEVELDGRTTILEATFENIAAFEERTGLGTYVVANRFGTGDVRIVDLVNVIWHFTYERDKDGWTKNDIGQSIVMEGPETAVKIATDFLILLFGAKDGEEVEGEDTQKKPTPRSRKAK